MRKVYWLSVTFLILVKSGEDRRRREYDKGAHISKIGNRRSKTLLYICAESARLHNKEIKLYYERRTLIDKKPRHYVLNAIANKLLRIIFTLVEKGEYYDANFIRQDPRVVKYN